MGAAWYQARSELRQRWRATLLLVLVVGLAGGALLTTLAGARRSSTAYDRLRAATLASDLEIAFDGPPSEDRAGSADRVRTLPQVEALTQLDYPFIVPAGSGMYPFLDFLAALPLDDEFGRTIDRVRLVDGHLPDPGEPRAVAVVASFAHDATLEVGDQLEVESFAPEQMEPLFTTGDAGPPAGPRLRLDVVGIVDAPAFLSDSTGAFQPKMFLSRSFAEVGHGIATYPGGVAVRLRHGAADVPAVTAAVRDLFPDAATLEVKPAGDIDGRIGSSIDVTVTALLLCALVAGIAGLVAVAQALSRHITASASKDRWLSALGMTAGQRRLATVAASLPVALGGAALAIAGAVVASPTMPVGLARRAEPDPGIAVDAPVLGLGGLVVVLVVLLLAGLAATRSSRATLTPERGGERGVSSWVRGLRRSLPPSATIGVGLALEPRAGTSPAVRSGLVGLALGTLGVISVVVFAASATMLVDSPARFGAPFDAAVAGFKGEVLDQIRPALIGDPDVTEVGALGTDLARLGGEELNLHALDALKGGPALMILDGRAPRADGEVALGAATLEEAGADLGDTVELRGTSGELLDATVVGTAAFPIIDDRSAVGSGALVTPADLRRIADPEQVNYTALIRWAADVDADAAAERLAERTGVEISPPRIPADVRNIEDVRTLPWALAGFLALLATLASLHALLVTVRLRRRELAVLKSLGFARRQLAGTVSWQASTIALVGLLTGVPLGIMVGRTVWRGVAGGIGVVDDPVVPLAGLLVVAATALVVANLVALIPARSARRVHPAVDLRAG